MTVLLSRELRSRFHLRSVPVRKGDTVRVLSGSFVGREERVAKIDRRGYAVTLDNVTLKAADEKLKPLALRPAHLVITRLNLSDPWRRRSLRVRDEAVTPEERGEAPTEGESAPEATPTPGRSVEEGADEAPPAPPATDGEPETGAGTSEPTPPPSKGKRVRTKRSARSEESAPEGSE